MTDQGLVSANLEVRNLLEIAVIVRHIMQHAALLQCGSCDHLQLFGKMRCAGAANRIDAMLLHL